MTLIKEEWVDPEGRSWLRGLPDGIPKAQASIGIPLGPPSLEDLGLPKDVEIRLHNQLFQRRIFDETDARARLSEIDSALRAALRVDVHRILAVYSGAGAIDHAS